MCACWGKSIHLYVSQRDPVERSTRQHWFPPNSCHYYCSIACIITSSGFNHTSLQWKGSYLPGAQAMAQRLEEWACDRKVAISNFSDVAGQWAADKTVGILGCFQVRMFMGVGSKVVFFLFCFLLCSQKVKLNEFSILWNGMGSGVCCWYLHLKPKNDDGKKNFFNYTTVNSCPKPCHRAVI